MWGVFWTFIRSFYSARLYDEISYGTSRDGFSYLMKISFVLSVFSIVITTILSLVIGSYVIYLLQFIPDLPVFAYFTGALLLILRFIFGTVILLIMAFINAFIFAVVISCLCYIAVIPAKIFDIILRAKLDSVSIRRIAAFSYLPATFIFWTVVIIITIFDKSHTFINIILYIIQFCILQISDLPRWFHSIVIMFIIDLAPLPIWVIYIAYGIICTKIGDIMIVKSARKNLNKVARRGSKKS